MLLRSIGLHLQLIRKCGFCVVAISALPVDSSGPRVVVGGEESAKEEEGRMARKRKAETNTKSTEQKKMKVKRKALCTREVPMHNHELFCI